MSSKPAGRFLGEVAVHGRADAYAHGDGLLVAAVTDADEVRRVALWRIER